MRWMDLDFQKQYVRKHHHQNHQVLQVRSLLHQVDFLLDHHQILRLVRME